MKNFLKTVFAVFVALLLMGVVKLFLFFTLLGALAGMQSASDVGTITDHSVYEIKLEGELVDRAVEDPMTTLQSTMRGNGEQQQLALNDVLANIEMAKTNDKIEGIYLHGGTLRGYLSNMQDLRKALQDFKQSGKFVIAYADNYTQSNYYLASVADTVMLNADGSLGWHGMNATITFYTGLLEKLGVKTQIFKVGTFKSAVEPFMLTKMSDANRLQMKSMMDQMWMGIRQEVGKSRGIKSAVLDSLADQYMDMQPQKSYVQNKLVDLLGYQNDADSLLNHLTGTDKFNLVSTATMTANQDVPKQDGEQIAVVYACGNIVDKGTSQDAIVGDKLVKTLADLTIDDDVKAVVLRVNSPGGSAFASEQIWNAEQQLKKKKPLIVSMGSYAASGGYYISCSADHIFAEPYTLTGSIGIFGMIPNFSGAMQKWGVSIDGVSTNKHADFETQLLAGNLSDEDKQIFQNEINRGYERFTKRCADGRHMKQDSIKSIAEGRVWTGLDGKRLGLVDEIGDLNQAVAYAAKKANLTEYYTQEYPAPKSMMEVLMEDYGEEARTQRLLEKTLGRDYLQLYNLLQEAEKGVQIQAAMPYQLTINN